MLSFNRLVEKVEIQCKAVSTMFTALERKACMWEKHELGPGSSLSPVTTHGFGHKFTLFN